MMIRYEDVSSLFSLDKASPSGLVWKRKPSKFSNNIVGLPAGKLTKDGYYQVPFLGSMVQAHRLVYTLSTGADLSSDFQVDHRDGNRANNFPDNLRKATHSQNCMNAKVRVDNRLGIKNVFLDKGGTYTVAVQANKKRHAKYGIKSLAEAVKIAQELRDTLHKNFQVPHSLAFIE